MKNSQAVLLVAGLLVASGAAGAFLLGTTTGADGSVLSRGPRGWWTARRYLEARGAVVKMLDEPLDNGGEGQGVLVLVLPWQTYGWDERLAALDHRLQAGGSVVVAYSGTGLPIGELETLRSLGLESIEPRGPAPLHPLRWRRFAQEEWTLVPPSGNGEKIRIGAPERIPVPPKEATILLRSEGGVAAAFSYPRWRGQVVVVPADALSNGRIGSADNAALLEGLRSLGRFWSFDEFHHGLTAPASETATRSRRAFDLYLVHILFLYVLAVLAVVQRFGPTWTEPALVTGSTASFLLGLARLHNRLGHHAEAAALLLSRARDLDPRLRPVAEGEAANTPAGFLALAQRTARAQSHSRRNG